MSKKNEQKLKSVFNLLQTLKPVYDQSNEYQKEFLSTIIGAAVFYLSSTKQTFSGMISEEANSLPKTQRVKEHQYPRKIVGKLLLDNPPNSVDKLKKLYYEKYGVWNWVTKKENGMLRPYQKAGVFTTPSAAYKKANIKLIKFKK